MRLCALTLSSSLLLLALPSFAGSADTAPAGQSQPVQTSQASLALTKALDTKGSFPGQASKGMVIGMVHLFGGAFEPWGEPLLDGRSYAINKSSPNGALYSILGMTYGGDAVNLSFQLPDARGRVLASRGQGTGLSDYLLGSVVGAPTATLAVGNLPAHSHTLGSSSSSTSTTGAGQAFDNRQPTLAVRYLIATEGNYPSAPGGPQVDPPFLGQVVAYAGTTNAPPGWAEANGQVLPISQNQVLFAVLGAAYGGDGTSTFALPDLRGRVPVGIGAQVALGQSLGSENVTLTTSTLPSHSHGLPSGGATDATGGGQPFSAMQPSLGLMPLVAMAGKFPSKNVGSFSATQATLGEIFYFAGKWVPSGFALANGASLPIAQNQELFDVLGTSFGGDGQTTFALPDLRDRVAVGTSSSIPVGTVFGSSTTTLTVAQLPQHLHSYACGGTTDCATCSGDADCATGRYCNAGGACVPQKAQGASCDSSASGDCYAASCAVCQTGNCVDGLCCDTACNGACEACSAALTGGQNGTCAAVACATGYTCDSVTDQCVVTLDGGSGGSGGAAGAGGTAGAAGAAGSAGGGGAAGADAGASGGAAGSSGSAGAAGSSGGAAGTSGSAGTGGTSGGTGGTGGAGTGAAAGSSPDGGLAGDAGSSASSGDSSSCGCRSVGSAAPGGVAWLMLAGLALVATRRRRPVDPTQHRRL